MAACLAIDRRSRSPHRPPFSIFCASLSPFRSENCAFVPIPRSWIDDCDRSSQAPVWSHRCQASCRCPKIPPQRPTPSLARTRVGRLRHAAQFRSNWKQSPGMGLRHERALHRLHVPHARSRTATTWADNRWGIQVGRLGDHQGCSSPDQPTLPAADVPVLGASSSRGDWAVECLRQSSLNFVIAVFSDDAQSLGSGNQSVSRLLLWKIRRRPCLQRVARTW